MLSRSLRPPPNLEFPSEKGRGIVCGMKLFGTDGIRGMANRDNVTPEMALKLGRAVALEFGAQAGGKPILIGRDTRQSGTMLEQAVGAGAASAGADVLIGGVLPTPAVAVVARQMGAAAAVVISASHNPFGDNGLKVFQGSGLKLDDAMEARLEAALLGTDIDNARPTGRDLGTITVLEDGAERYIKTSVEDFAKGLDLTGVNVVLDCANGASYHTSPEVLRRLGANVTVVADQPDGFNINEHCGSTHPNNIANLVRPEYQGIGISHDGDADRVVFVDEEGTTLDGDEVLAILAMALSKKNQLAGNKVVATVMSNLGLDEAMSEHGINVERTAVGDRHVIEKMLADGLNLGGEQSGHIILSDQNPTGDGLNTALQVLRVMRENRQGLCQLRRCMTKFPQLLINEMVSDKPAFDTVPGLTDAVAAVEDEMGKTGRVLLRYSGTEKKIRLLLEARESAKLKDYADRILDPIRQHLSPA